MKLGIYSIEKTLFEGDVQEIVAKTTTGQITVLPHHLPLVSRLTKSSLKLIDQQGKEQYIDIEGGYLEVQSESTVVVLVDVI